MCTDLIKTVIIDDEFDGREVIKRIISGIDYLKFTGEADSVRAGIELIKNCKPDLVFLDVELKDGTGFNILEQISDIEFEVIFQTAFQQFAIRAIKFAALDYLMKPIDAIELRKSVEKARLKISEGSDNNGKLSLLKEQINKQKPDKLALPTEIGFIFLKISDIVHCSADSNYTIFHLKDKSEKIVCHTLKEYDELLSDYDFMRIHKSHLVNLNYVKSYQKGKGGYIILQDGTEIEVSQRKKEEFLQKFAKL